MDIAAISTLGENSKRATKHLHLTLALSRFIANDVNARCSLISEMGVLR